MNLMNLLNLLRVKDWLKNLIIFSPLVFTGYLNYLEYYTQLIIGFLYFSIFSSTIYIINDLKDLEEDKLHSLKKNDKVIASGKISKKNSYFILTLLIVILSISILSDYNYFKIPIYYFLISLIYIFLIRKIAYLDVLIISFGYNLRVMFGSFIIGVETSLAMHLTIFSLAMYIISLKRLKELTKFTSARKSLFFYKKYFLDKINIFLAISTLALYLLYVLDKKIELIITIPFAAFSLMRFRSINLNSESNYNPIDVFFSDKIIIISTFLYIALLFFLFYY